MKILSLHEASFLQLQERRQHLPHALLLIGQQGLGKFALAQAFAASLLCEQPDSHGKACGNCQACHWFSQGNHPDFRLLQPEALAETVDQEEGKKKPSQQITIDQVRALDEFLGVGSHRGGPSIILVNPAEAMNRNTANAILKILEEPPAHVHFLLVSNEPNRLLPTIRSRCQVMPLRVPSTEQAIAVLAAEGLEDAARWLAWNGGSIRFAMEMSAGKPLAWLESLSRALSAGQKIDALSLAGELDKQIKASKGELTLKQLIETLQKWLVDLTLLKNGLPVRYFLDQEAKIGALAAMISPVRLIRLYRAMNQHRLEAEQPVNARLFLEGVFLDYRALFSR